MTRLAASSLTVTRGRTALLDGVSLEAQSGEPVAVVGPSGAGKSTLLAVLAGLTRPDRGVVTLDDVQLGQVVDLRARVSVVLQSYGLVGILTASENIEVVLHAAGWPRGRIRTVAAKALADVGLTGRADNLVEELSGGEQQRVALARALAREPQVLIADEPTAELDAVSRGHVLALLRQVAADGAVVVLATHDDEVADACPRRLHLAHGRLLDS